MITFKVELQFGDKDWETFVFEDLSLAIRKIHSSGSIGFLLWKVKTCPYWRTKEHELISSYIVK